MVGARAVVTRDVPPYSVVAGNPARIVRRRFDEATVAALLDAAWWDLPHAEVTRLAPLLSGADAAGLVAAARSVAAGEAIA